MKNKVLVFLVAIFFVSAVTKGQSTYFPDTAWQTKTPLQLGMNKQWLDSAVSFAMYNENKMERDLRIATLKAYAREPGYAIIGPMKERGG
ncbi:MAG: hypothetical protein WBA96_11880, partial [Chitinophagaceae bacterium]